MQSQNHQLVKKNKKKKNYEYVPMEGEIQDKHIHSPHRAGKRQIFLGLRRKTGRRMKITVIIIENRRVFVKKFVESLQSFSQKIPGAQGLGADDAHALLHEVRPLLGVAVGVEHRFQ